MLLDALSLSRLLLKLSPDVVDLLQRVTGDIESGRKTLVIRVAQHGGFSLVFASLRSPNNMEDVLCVGKGDTVAEALLSMLSDYKG